MWAYLCVNTHHSTQELKHCGLTGAQQGVYGQRIVHRSDFTARSLHGHCMVTARSPHGRCHGHCAVTAQPLPWSLCSYCTVTIRSLPGHRHRTVIMHSLGSPYTVTVQSLHTVNAQSLRSPLRNAYLCGAKPRALNTPQRWAAASVAALRSAHPNH